MRGNAWMFPICHEFQVLFLTSQVKTLTIWIRSVCYSP